jgi:hypothetical protein
MVAKSWHEDCNYLPEEINPGDQEISRDSSYCQIDTNRQNGMDSCSLGNRYGSTEMPVTAAVTLLSSGLSSKNAIIADNIGMIALQQLAVFFQKFQSPFSTGGDRCFSSRELEIIISHS